MTAITHIRRLREWGIFHDFTWPADLPEFKKYNLIYGWNGSGKTTLSRIFRFLEARIPPPNGKIKLTVGGRDISHDQFTEITLPIRVFNRDFIAESVFPIGGEVAPIFILGKESIEKQKQVEQLKVNLAEEQTKLDKNLQNKNDAESFLDRFCVDKATIIRDTLRSAGQNRYNNYDKRHFHQCAEDMKRAGNRQTQELSPDGRDKLLMQIRSGPKSKLEPLTYRIPDLKAIEKTVTDLLSTTVMSAAIPLLKDDPELSLWVYSGLKLHKERETKSCLFCNQDISNERLSVLERHFSNEYEEFLRRVSDEIRAIQAMIKASMDLVLPNTAQVYDDLSFEFESALFSVRRERDFVKSVLETLVKALEDKQTRVFQRVALDVTVSAINNDVVECLNKIIFQHNEACDDFQMRIDTARMKIEADLVASNLNEFVELGNAVQAAENAVTTTSYNVKVLEGNIAQLEREIVEHRQPAEELNADLKQYLGHDELHLEIKETGYIIMRGNTPATALSEGETTAIALLYFLKSLQDHRFDLPNGVIVLDDPVSSLDQNALYAAFGYIRAKTQSARQLFALTHNFTFFKLLRGWFRNLRNEDKRAWCIYMLECAWNCDRRAASLRPIDPLLMEFDSEYQYLFSRIYRMAIEPSAPSLEAYYCAPSMARRVLETFLAFRLPDVGGQNRLWSQIVTVPFDEAKKSRIYRFLQMHSHRDSIGDPDEDLTLLTESRSILNDLISFMQTADEDHCCRMITRLTPKAEGEMA